MRITAVTTHVVRSPFTYGDPEGAGAVYIKLRTQDTLLVRVDTDAGITGWGEGFGFAVGDTTRRAVETLIAPLCIGQDPQDIAGLTETLHRRLHNAGRNGPITFGIAAIDIALWDIAGKAAGVPLHALLGGAKRDRIPAYASLLRYGKPDLVARHAGEAAARGFAAVKLHEVDPEGIRAARAAAPDTPLMIDVNCPWTVEQAVAFSRQVEACRIRWLEEPCWPPEDVLATAAVRAQCPIPIAAGENVGGPIGFRDMFEAAAVDFAQPSASKLGVSGLRAVMDMAAGRGVAVAPHSPYFGPGLVATIHVLATLTEPIALEWYYADLEARIYGTATEPVGGQVIVPQSPGLGLDPDPAVIGKYGP